MNKTILLEACSKGNLEVVKFIIENKLCNAYELDQAIAESYRRKNIDIADYITNNENSFKEYSSPNSQELDSSNNPYAQQNKPYEQQFIKNIINCNCQTNSDFDKDKNKDNDKDKYNNKGPTTTR